jgi:two-component system chemotaxis sensor kinase CheA
VILVTSLDAPEHRERGVTAGADAYIAKGKFDQGELLDTIGRLL